jgi:hypothetical protein
MEGRCRVPPTFGRLSEMYLVVEAKRQELRRRAADMRDGYELSGAGNYVQGRAITKGGWLQRVGRQVFGLRPGGGATVKSSPVARIPLICR